jgi:tetratricopeptide (TPR) repeat protein
MALNNLAVLYYNNNAHKKAQSAYEEALKIYRTLARTNPGFVLFCVRCCYSKAQQDC